ncbi:MAG TPA: phosphoenolpyruvate--protein phosphotransferase [Pyrinomonadaceae bacterium]|jgi:phosphotransferase system enzyme I (PtsI)|nr:phosphoenolpyruvate--protein phosphotransferase [Pyrinomonadaceae bacterium]
MSRRAKIVKREMRWRGVAVSEGVRAGRVLRIHTGGRGNIYRATLDPGDIKREVRRFQAAVRLSRRQLLAIKRRAEVALGAEHAYIFDAQLLMLEDRKLLDEVEDYIRQELANAEWAVKVASDKLLAVYAEIKDDYLRERSSDIEDVTRRLLVALSGEAQSRRLTEDAIVVAEELLPSAAAELDFSHVRAIASDAGGWTSHTAIIARGLGIPAIVGLRDLYRHARTGDEIVIDAGRGVVVLHPTGATIEHFTEARRLAHSSAGVADDGSAPLLTTDGVEIILRANVELPPEYEGVRRYGARGIGLFRSEFLFSQRNGAPTEDEQCAAYVEVAALAGADGAKVRLFDLGGDKHNTGAFETERNPALGLRAIRYSFQHEGMLRTQVRALLRAAAKGRLDVVLPMISDVSEVRRARRIIEEERALLSAEGRETGELKIGAMIEVPAAVMVADQLAREVDFFSLGTNDLVQYLLAVDRGNDEVAAWFRTLHPAVLQSIKRTIDAAGAAGIPAIVCGEMAATPAYALVLVGLGARVLSMAAAAMPRVRRTLAQVDATSAVEIASLCLRAATADDAEETVRVELGGRWPHLFLQENLPAAKSGE